MIKYVGTIWNIKKKINVLADKINSLKKIGGGVHLRRSRPKSLIKLRLHLMFRF